MHFSTSFAAAIVALTSSVFAQTPDFDSVTVPTKNQVIQAGSNFQVVWTLPVKYQGAIDISLLGGKTPDTLQPISDIASNVDNSAGSYTWAVGSSLGAEPVYGLLFKLASNTTIYQYSNPFSIASSSSSTNASSSTTMTGSSSATMTSATMTSSQSRIHPLPSHASMGNSTVTGMSPTMFTVTSTQGGAVGGSTNTATSSPSTTAVAHSGAVQRAAAPLALVGGLLVAFLIL